MREQTAGVENAGVKNAGVDRMGGKCRSKPHEYWIANLRIN